MELGQETRDGTQGSKKNRKGVRVVVRAEDRGATALWYEAPGVAVLREEPPPSADDIAARGLARVRTQWTAISRGTERLVCSGLISPSEYVRMRAPFQAGDFPFPVKYGYCAAGVVDDGPADMVGRRIFALHPHQDVFWLPAGDLVTLPEALPTRRATLAANMETALNAVWDSGAGPGDRIVVIGAGIVGALIAIVCARLPGAEVVAIDPQPDRAGVLARFGVACIAPQAAGPGSPLLREPLADIVFHTSATSAGLAMALGAAGFEGRVVEVSWFGAREATIPLGGAFHSRRLQLVSSQVGHVAAARRARWTHRRRLLKALDLLCDERLDALITDEFAFSELPRRLPAYLAGPAGGLAAVVRY